MSQFANKDDYSIAKADEMIAAEIGRQGRMWGVERDDTTNRQLFDAAFAQLDFLDATWEHEKDGTPTWGTREECLALALHRYPTDWCGFRDYGSDVANLVVAAAYLRNEIVRRVRAGDSTERTSRNVVEQPYCELNQPNAIEP